MNSHTQKKKVLFLITKSNWGGAQRYLFDLATHLPTDTYEIVVALGGDGPLIPKLIERGFRVITIPGLQRDISLRKELLASWRIAHIIRDEDPDILHINSSKAGGIGAFLGRVLGVPRVIFTAHGWAFNENRALLSRFLIKTIHWLTVLLAHHTIAVSQAIHDQLDWPGVAKKMTVVHNGRTIPTLLDRTAARTALIQHDERLAAYADDLWTLTIGELHYTKGHNVVIAAIADLVHAHPALRHLIISAGEARATLEDQIIGAGLEEHVFLLGALDEAAQYLKAADVFVLASRTEALSYVVTEAAMAELPIVASDVGGIPEIVTDKLSATLVPVADTTALVAAIDQYLSNHALAAEHAANAKTASARFSMEQMIAATTAVYRD